MNSPINFERVMLPGPNTGLDGSALAQRCGFIRVRTGLNAPDTARVFTPPHFSI